MLKSTSLPQRKVVFVNAPNSDELAFPGVSSSTNGKEHTDWANFPHLGILSLASMIDQVPGFEAAYFDCVVCNSDRVTEFVNRYSGEIIAVCFSLITANYAASVNLIRRVKQINPAIVVIVGNDHFTAMHRKVMEDNRDLIDCGLLGNEVFGPLKSVLEQINKHGAIIDFDVRGLVAWEGDDLTTRPQGAEPLFGHVDYTIIDRWFDHSSRYDENFQQRIGPRLHNLLGRKVTRGTPIEFARGCIKFAQNDACSFCSIQFGGMWRNSVQAADEAWDIVKQAFEAGYDYLYVTADELPLTFAKLIREMAQNQPPWWKALEHSRRPVLTGYARADGLRRPDLLAEMYNIGFRILYVGIDAGSPQSLAAMNKPINNDDMHLHAKRLFEANQEALDRLGQSGMKMKAGLILGHLGMTTELLKENIASYQELVVKGKQSIVSVDVELLSPEPGSLDFLYLTQPNKADEAARRLGLSLGDATFRKDVARKYSLLETFDRGNAIQDYIAAVMPELTFDVLAAAREDIRSFCVKNGITVGAEL